MVTSLFVNSRLIDPSNPKTASLLTCFYYHVVGWVNENRNECVNITRFYISTLTTLFIITCKKKVIIDVFDQGQFSNEIWDAPYSQDIFFCEVKFLPGNYKKK